MRNLIEKVAPRDIETRSFEIITEELGNRVFEPDTELIVKRCIHTSADFEYADNLCFSENAAAKMMEAIESGVSIVTDTNMVKAGINKVDIGRYGGQVHCFMSDDDVAAAARISGATRASESMKKAASLGEDYIFAIGNAPTALVTLYDLMQEGRINPVGIIGVPVGFVNVVQSKELIMTSDAPYIVAKGRKGGSNIAACIVNALLYMINNERHYWNR